MSLNGIDHLTVVSIDEGSTHRDKKILVRRGNDGINSVLLQALLPSKEASALYLVDSLTNQSGLKSISIVDNHGDIHLLSFLTQVFDVIRILGGKHRFRSDDASDLLSLVLTQELVNFLD